MSGEAAMHPAQGVPESRVCRWCHAEKYLARGWVWVCIGDGERGCDVVAVADRERAE